MPKVGRELRNLPVDICARAIPLDERRDSESMPIIPRAE